MFRELEVIPIDDIRISKNESIVSPETKRHVEELRLFILAELQARRVPNKKIVEAATEIVRLLKQEGIDTDLKRSVAFKKVFKKNLLDKFGGCVGCGKKDTSSGRHTAIAELHHIIPRGFGGESTKENALLVCRECHVTIHQ